MKHTLEQLESSHKQIVHERDVIRANLESELHHPNQCVGAAMNSFVSSWWNVCDQSVLNGKRVWMHCEA